MPRTEGSHTTRRKRVDVRGIAWAAMRIHKRFTTANIRATTGIGQTNLEKYIKVLHRSGYLKLERPRQLGRSLGHAVWRLVRDTGPQYPIPRKDQSGVWDQNQQTLYPFVEEKPHGHQAVR
jgi:hypothetical protein